MQRLEDSSTGSVPPRTAAFVVGLITLAAGTTVLVGWLLDIPVLRSVHPSFVMMTAHTAVAFTLAGLSLSLRARFSRVAPARWVASACAGATAVSGLFTLCQHLFGLDLRTDQWLIQEQAPGAGILASGPMGQLTALNFLLFGCALLLERDRRAALPIQGAALLAGVLSLLPLIGCFYGASMLLVFGRHFQMSLITAGLFILMGLGVLLLHPAEGLLRPFIRGSVGGWLALRLGPFVIAIPLAVGWIWLRGESLGYFDAPLGTAFAMVAMMVLFACLIYWSASRLNLAMARQREAALRVGERQYEALANNTDTGFVVLDGNGIVVSANEPYRRLAGAERIEDVVGHSVTEWTAPDEKEGNARAVALCAARGSIQDFETVYQHADGTRTHVSVNATVEKAPDGGIRIASFCRNITGRRLAEEARRRAEQLLLENSSRFRAFVEQAPVAIGVFDLAGIGQYANDTFLKMLGLQGLEEVVGRPALEFFAPRFREESLERTRRRSLGLPVPAANESVAIRPDGSEFPVQLAVSAIQLTDGLVSIAFLTDLSEIKRTEEALRESKQLVESIVDNVPLMIFVKEARDLRFVTFNKAGEALLGLDRKDLLGKSDRELFPPEQAAFFTAKDRQVLDSGASLDIPEEPLQTLRNGERLVHTRKVCIKGADGRTKYLLGISEDITERRLEEDRLKRMSMHLEEKNAELERFTYTISHDLKSPLVTVRTFLGYLQRDLQSRDADAVAEDIDFVLGATEKMARILDELLQLSRVGYQTNPFQEVSLQEVVAEAVGLLAGPIATRGVAVEVVEEPFVLVGDRTRLVEVFLNLLDNAVKNMGEQATPRIVVGVESSGDPLTFFVRDNGIGIEPRYKDQIFNLFEKLDPDSAGTGVGLALVKRIVEVHGGRIWMESAGPGQGSTFRFTVSRARRGAVMEAAG